MIEVGDMVRVKTIEELRATPNLVMDEVGDFLDVDLNVYFTTGMFRYCGHAALVVVRSGDGYILNFGSGERGWTFTEKMLIKI